MKKIKILRIITRLNIGGPAIHAVILSEGLDKSRFESLLVCGNAAKDEGDMFYYALKKNIKPIFIPELKRRLNFFYDLAAFTKIFKIIKKEQPDIIHTHTAKAGCLGRIAGIFYNCLNIFARKRIKIIHTFHGHIFDGYFNKFQSHIFVIIERILAGFTDKIITVSVSVKEELLFLRIAKKDKIEVIPLGLELGKFLKIPSKEEGVLSIGIVGRLAPIKNHRLFLEAAVKTIKDNPEIRLTFQVVGDGELRRDLEGYTDRLGIKAQVNFLGWQDDLVNVYSRLDVVALTSMNEGTPVSLIEAMASARAVVATDVGGVRDLLAGEGEKDIKVKTGAGFKVLERGTIVKPGDCFAFANALSFVLGNNEFRKKIGNSAREFVEARFTKERLIKDMEGLYNTLLSVNEGH